MYLHRSRVGSPFSLGSCSSNLGWVPSSVYFTRICTDQDKYTCAPRRTDSAHFRLTITSLTDWFGWLSYCNTCGPEPRTNITFSRPVYGHLWTIEFPSCVLLPLFCSPISKPLIPIERPFSETISISLCMTALVEDFNVFTRIQE
jgi:hypothetical protein